ncbi:Hint domain-containing protein [Pelagovum pacificum]|uniref:Hint domain-containing protein n=1 Tax=Pelagovum pacificum TaxID=2588711 RepID=A0A5C5GAW5_9RHOB|nr:Hint domain-containing protein [Pelagovum pacificum]QQA41369.1 Hint domain-containing protein [Pelagovum pacificum]TNY31828.1 Hint domain-containing protein [Pelagovum pacificum]
MTNTDLRAVQTLPVFPDRDFVVVSGVAENDPISFADELVMDDIYGLSPRASRKRLTVAFGSDQVLTVADGSEVGTPGNLVHMDCCITLMVPDGSTYEALILVEVEDDTAAGVYLLPLATLQPKVDYRLVGLDRKTASTRFAEVACVSFTRGTRITMANGEQRPIELLEVGDKVLTRDDGPQQIRWIGQNTLRAVGSFAPVVIREGTLHNENDLIVSPDHRIFVYQRRDRLGAGRAEVLVKVRHLINGDSVYQQDGGFVDYFQLLFDDHQIIYAEGIAAESMMVDQRTRGAVPEAVSRRLGEALSGHAHRHHLDYEVQETLLSKPDAVDLLRRASSS